MFKRLLIVASFVGCILSFSSCSNDDAETVSYEENYKKGIAFLEENMKREGVITTESGLQYEVLTEGTGATPSMFSSVRCHYKGYLIDGTVFDSSYDRDPATFPLNGVIDGWNEGLQLMKEGGKNRLYIPFYLGYGQQPCGIILPFSTLIFDVELIEVLK